MDKLIDFYQQRLNLQLAAFSRIEHEDAMVAVVYRVTQPNRSQLILKVFSTPQHFQRELYFLKHFAKLLPVPEIIDVVPPMDEANGAILMEFIPGELLKTEEFTRHLAHEIGAILARIHLHHAKGYGDLIQGNLSTDPRIYFTFKFEESLEECSAHLSLELIEKCRKYHDEHINLLTAVDGPCLVHRDFRPGNLIIQKGKLQGIIDWAGGRASFAEDDLCPLEHGEWANNPESKKQFLEGYASIRPLPDYKEIMPLLRLSKSIASIGFMVKQQTWNNSQSRFYQLNRAYLDALLR